MTRTCRVCGEPELRPHRHGRQDIHRNIRYGRLVALKERQWLRSVFEAARRQLEGS